MSDFITVYTQKMPQSYALWTVSCGEGAEEGGGGGGGETQGGPVFNMFTALYCTLYVQYTTNYMYVYI